MNERKFSFIACVNDEAMYEESLLYLRHLEIPDGFSIDFVAIRGASSMTSGYEEGRRQSDAKYKIYMHQDVLVMQKDILSRLLRCFQKDDKLGLIGLAGCRQLPESFVWWEAQEHFLNVAHTSPRQAEFLDCPSQYVPETEVQAVDGVFMATQYDVSWRADLFTGWHFYDISQSFEYRRHGYKVMLPEQTDPWIIHCTVSKVLVSDEYGYWAKVCRDEYREAWGQGI